MGRSKQAPKRRKLDDQDDGGVPCSLTAAHAANKEQQQAIATLLSSPPDAVDAAAAEATRIGIRSWPRIDSLVCIKCHPSGPDDVGTATPIPPSSETSTLPSCFHGLGKCSLDADEFSTLRELHQMIQRQAKQWTSWSGSPSDPRRRVFGFLPRSFLGLEQSKMPSWKDQIDVTMPLQAPADRTTKQQYALDHHDQNPDEERQRNERAMVELDGGDALFVSSAQTNDDGEAKLKQTISKLLDRLRPKAPRHVQPYLSLRYLVAAQPNLHCGRHLLPAHFDHPLKDGFGICIVTVAIKGDAQVFLEESTVSASSSKDGNYGVLSVSEGEAYMLSGAVRNQCTHGVLADMQSGERESLNLRFGIHGVMIPEDEENASKREGAGDVNAERMQVVHPDEVLRHW